MTDEQTELLLEYLYWIGYSLDYLAAAHQHLIPEDAPITVLETPPEPPPMPSTMQERYALQPRKRFDLGRWRPV